MKILQIAGMKGVYGSAEEANLERSGKSQKRLLYVMGELAEKNRRTRQH